MWSEVDTISIVYCRYLIWVKTPVYTASKKKKKSHIQYIEGCLQCLLKSLIALNDWLMKAGIIDIGTVVMRFPTNHIFVIRQSHTQNAYVPVCPHATWFSSQWGCRGSAGETALSAGHVGPGTLRPQTLHWQEVGAQGLRSPPPSEPEIQRTHTQSNGHKVCDGSRQVSGLCLPREVTLCQCNIMCYILCNLYTVLDELMLQKTHSKHYISYWPRYF